jgi:hypothetical protein
MVCFEVPAWVCRAGACQYGGLTAVRVGVKAWHLLMWQPLGLLWRMCRGGAS